ncbi:hypothetical protein Pst134EB_003811, partial [Puccinia striiformis f. sp. tritici]
TEHNHHTLKSSTPQDSLHTRMCLSCQLPASAKAALDWIEEDIYYMDEEWTFWDIKKIIVDSLKYNEKGKLVEKLPVKPIPKMPKHFCKTDINFGLPKSSTFLIQDLKTGLSSRTCSKADSLLENTESQIEFSSGFTHQTTGLSQGHLQELLPVQSRDNLSLDFHLNPWVTLTLVVVKLLVSISITLEFTIVNSNVMLIETSS